MSTPSFSFGSLLRRIFWSVILVAIIGYGGVIFWFMQNEPKLVFHPSRGFVEPAASLEPYVSRVELRTPDSLKLVGWEVWPSSADSSRIWILYLHGNGGNIAGASNFYLQLSRLGYHVLSVDYRGYGESDGRPDEQGLYRDASTCYEYLTAIRHIPAGDIVVYGHSLGSAVAIHLAAQRRVAALVTEGGFTSIADRGHELYPWLPVGLVVKNRFDAIRQIRDVRVPKLIIHAVDDQVVPFSHGLRLFQEASVPKQFLQVTGGHDQAYIQSETLFFGTLRKFIAGLPASNQTQN